LCRAWEAKRGSDFFARIRKLLPARVNRKAQIPKGRLDKIPRSGTIVA
jgi:hypothetical protein